MCAKVDIDFVNMVLCENSSGIFFFGKPGCKYCDALEADLSDMKLSYQKYMLDPTQYDYNIVAEHLKTRVGLQTFPMLFVGNVKVGGYGDFKRALMTNVFEEILNENGLKFDSMF